ncbi:MAG: hypothetical protein GX883_04075 [Firmicutes bacterium]|nr:hypothetical protein [Bacillota bacterium]
MGEISAGSIMLFGYLSMALLAGVFIRSQFKIFQKYLIPGSIIAGFILLVIGPGFLSLVKAPLGDDADFLVFNLLTVIFIIIGLRGRSAEKGSRSEVLQSTALLTILRSFQLIVGILFTLVVVLLINPGLFRGFGSMLMLGQGFEPAIASYFGGSMEYELGFTGGQSIAFAFSAIGFLSAYLFGLAYIVLAKKWGFIVPVTGEGSVSVQTGVIGSGEEKKSAGLLTMHGQTVETFSVHLAVIGFAVLVLYGFLKVIALMMVHNFSPGVVIVTETLFGFNYLFALLAGMAVRGLLRLLKIDALIDRGILDRLLGVAVDFMVVAAIASIPLVITLANLWETLLLSLGGAGLTLLAVNLLMGRVCREKNIGRQAAMFGFLTGNISSSIALFRVLDPHLEDPFIGDLAYAGGLSFIAALPLFFFMNIPVFGGLIQLAAAAGLTLLYGGALFCAWYFLIYRRGRAGR